MKCGARYNAIVTLIANDNDGCCVWSGLSGGTLFHLMSGFYSAHVRLHCILRIDVQLNILANTLSSILHIQGNDVTYPIYILAVFSEHHHWLESRRGESFRQTVR